MPEENDKPKNTFITKCMLAVISFLLGISTTVVAFLYHKVDHLEEVIVEVRTMIRFLHGQ